MPRRKQAVTDIATMFCYIRECDVYYLPQCSPRAVGLPHFFIFRASQDFGGVAWVMYDAAVGRQAFITGNWQ